MPASHRSGVAVSATTAAGRDLVLSGASLYLFAGGSAGLGVAMARKIGARSGAVGDSFCDMVLSGALLPLARGHFGAERFLLLSSHDESGHDAPGSSQQGGDYSTASIVASVGHLAPIMYDHLLGSMVLKEWRSFQSRLRMAVARVVVSGRVEP